MNNNQKNSGSENSSIYFMDLFYTLINSWKSILFVTLLLSIIGFLYTTYFIPKRYESYTTIIIQSKLDKDELNPTDIELSKSLTNTYIEIIKSNRILDKVMDSLPFEINSSVLRKSIEVESKNATEILYITVNSDTPNHAAIIANLISTIFEEEVVKIMSVDNVNVLDLAMVSKNPVSPNIFLNTIYSGLFGFIVTVGYILTKNYLDDSVKTQKDVEDILGINVIGVISKYDNENLGV